jgi:hypothetical protein
MKRFTDEQERKPAGNLPTGFGRVENQAAHSLRADFLAHEPHVGDAQQRGYHPKQRNDMRPHE